MWKLWRKWRELFAGATPAQPATAPTAKRPAAEDGSGRPLGYNPAGQTEAPQNQPQQSPLPMHRSDLYELSRAGAVNVVDLTLPHTLDIHEFDRLNESILAMVRGEPEGSWVLDLSRLSYMGSAALGLMVNLRQQIKQSGGRLVLCGLTPQLMHIFKTCCMERLFKIVKSREDAIAAAA